MKLSDTHCHLYFDHFRHDLDAVLDQAWKAGVEMIVVPGIDVETSRQALELARSDERIFAAVGVHPNSGSTWNSETPALLADLARDPRVVAIGEIGLDYYRDTTPRPLQVRVLAAQLELAAACLKPVILHDRDASDDLFPTLLAWARSRPGQPAGVFHSFGAAHPGLDDLVEAGFFFGISGPVTFHKTGGMAQVVSALPLERILLETDSPFLTPHPFRGQRNEPGYVQYIARRVAAIKSIPVEEAAAQTCQNAAHLFRGESIIE